MAARPFAYEGRFPTTHWSLVVRAGHDAAETQREALEQLLRRYLPALHAHLVHTRRVAPDEADDLLQDFVASRIIEKGLVGRADQELGKFRWYLLAGWPRCSMSRWHRPVLSPAARAALRVVPWKRFARGSKIGHGRPSGGWRWMGSRLRRPPKRWGSASAQCTRPSTA